MDRLKKMLLSYISKTSFADGVHLEEIKYIFAFSFSELRSRVVFKDQKYLLLVFVT